MNKAKPRARKSGLQGAVRQVFVGRYRVTIPSGKVPNSFLIAEGVSLLTDDNAPLAAVLTLRSKNRETGDIPNVTVIRSDVNPVSARWKGMDNATCGACQHRGTAGDGSDATCYVVINHGPSVHYRSLTKGSLGDARPGGPWHDYVLAALEYRGMLRLTSYGEAPALGYDAYAPFIDAVRRHPDGGTTLGYTERHTDPDLDPRWRNIMMASVQSDAEGATARASGWRTFRTGATFESRVRGTEALCPKSKHEGMTCAVCRQCTGSSGRKGSVFIPVHGGGKSGHLVTKFDARKRATG